MEGNGHCRVLSFRVDRGWILEHCTSARDVPFYGMRRLHGDTCCHNISNDFLRYLEGGILFLSLPRRLPSQNAQIGSHEQLDHTSHTKHIERMLCRNLLKQARSELSRRSMHAQNAHSVPPGFFVLEHFFVKEVQATKVPSSFVSKHSRVKSQRPYIHPSIFELNHNLCTEFSSRPDNILLERWQISRMTSRI